MISSVSSSSFVSDITCSFCIALYSSSVIGLCFLRASIRLSAFFFFVLFSFILLYIFSVYSLYFVNGSSSFSFALMSFLYCAVVLSISAIRFSICSFSSFVSCSLFNDSFNLRLLFKASVNFSFNSLIVCSIGAVFLSTCFNVDSIEFSISVCFSSILLG